MKNKISIIVPVYNASAYLEKCINCLLNQTYNNIEIILINDGSVDDSYDKCKKLAEQYDNIVVITQKNLGPSAARNSGIRVATGDYITFVDADDEIDNNYLELMESSIDEDIDIVCCSYKVLESGKEESMFENDFSANTVLEKEPIFLQLMYRHYGHQGENSTAIGVPWGKLFRTSFLEEYNLLFDTNLRRMQDNDFIMRCVYFAKGVKYINNFLYIYRVEHNNSYKTYSYSPDIYLKILNNRDKFYKAHPDLNTDLIRRYFIKECFIDLMLSIHYYVGESETKVMAIENIKQLVKEGIFSQLIKQKEVKRELTRKQVIQYYLVKYKRYNILYHIYKNR